MPIVTVLKIGNGMDIPPGKTIQELLKTEGPYRPDTKELFWEVIQERATEFDIRVLADPDV